jgi:hypothetical protein
MADIVIPKSVPCQFGKTGWAPCKKPSTNGWCSEHENIACVSCGQHAVQKCDGQMGGLACGAPLCATCQHGSNGGHITAEADAREQQEEREARMVGGETVRALTERGVPLGLPKHLKELLEGDHKEYELTTCYMLEIKHGLMGFFPAIRTGTKKILITSDKALMFRVWRSLEPRDSRVIASEYMMNSVIGVAYPMAITDFEKEQSRPLKIFSTAEVDALFKAESSPFEWAPGLIGAQTSEIQFNALIEKAAQEHRLAA